MPTIEQPATWPSVGPHRLVTDPPRKTTICKICNQPRNSEYHKLHSKRARHLPTHVATSLERLLPFNCPICGSNNKSPHYCNRIINSLRVSGLVPPKYLEATARFELQRRLNLHKEKQVPMDVIAINTTLIHAYVIKLTLGDK